MAENNSDSDDERQVNMKAIEEMGLDKTGPVYATLFRLSGRGGRIDDQSAHDAQIIRLVYGDPFVSEVALDETEPTA